MGGSPCELNFTSIYEFRSQTQYFDWKWNLIIQFVRVAGPRVVQGESGQPNMKIMQKLVLTTLSLQATADNSAAHLSAVCTLLCTVMH